MKLEINYINKNGKRTDMWRLSNMLPKSQWVNEKTQRGHQKIP